MRQLNTGLPAALMAACLAMSCAWAGNVNGGGASLNLSTTDLSSGAAQANGAGARLLAAGTPGVGVVSTNGYGAKAIFEPMNLLAGAGDSAAPAADFSATSLTGIAPLDVQFTDLSTGGLYEIQSWSWDFGDGSPAGAAQNPAHEYENPGAYTVTLTITVANNELVKIRQGYITVSSGVHLPAANWAGLLVLSAALALLGAATAGRSTASRTRALPNRTW